MSDDSLSFEKVQIQRAPGFDGAGPMLGELSPGINIVYGPNGSGKTTLARAVMTLLWPGDPALDRSRLVGLMRGQGSTWRLDFADGRLQVQRDGQPQSGGPEVPSRAARSRYYLCLKELLSGQGEGFAEFIVRESAGGYDVARAAKNLALEQPTGRPRRVTGAVEEAREKLREVEERQYALRGEEERLSVLEEELEAAKIARRRREVLSLALELDEALAAAEQTEDRLEEFPDQMALLRGDEDQVVRELRADVAELEVRQRQHAAEVARCEEEIAASPLPEGGGADILGGLEEAADRLAEVDRERRAAAADLAGAESEVRAARAALGAEPPESVVTTEQIRRLEGLTRRVDGMQGEARAYQLVRDLLAVDDEEFSRDALRGAADALRRWTNAGGAKEAEDQRSTKLIWAIWGCAAVVCAVAVVLAILVHPAALLLLLVALVLAIVAWRFRAVLAPPHSNGDERSVHRREFERFELPGPVTWSEDAVRRRMEELFDTWIELGIDEEKRARWSSYAGDRGDVIASLEDARRERQEIFGELGIAEDEGGEAALYWAVKHLCEWQQARRSEEKYRARLEAAQGELQSLLEQVNRGLAGLGLEEVQTLEDARAAARRLRDEARRVAELRRELDGERREVDDTASAIEGNSRDIQKIFQRLGVEDHRELEELCRRYNKFQEARERHDEASTLVDDRLRRLRQDPLYEEKLLALDGQELRQEREELEPVADRHDELIREIEGIRARVDDAKQANFVEERQVDFEQARRALERERERDYGRAIGAELAAYVEEETRDRNRPEVFHRARELFAQITHGRYSLELHEGDQGPRFRAIDTTRQVGLALDELSGGTRVQLLVAVRVAFVERQERGAKLPLIFDEALANSDDRRAGALIDAVIEIARQDRQIFYFTAQADEVQKWESRLDAAGVCWGQQRLGALQQQSDGPVYGDEVAPPAWADVVDPDGLNHGAYGRALGIGRGVSPWQPVANVHLWFLVDDPKLLYRLLSGGFVRWGQMKNLADLQGLGAVGLTEDAFLRIQSRAQVVESLREARLIGRGKPVDREVLQESGAVTDNFIDQVADLVERLEGDAKRLLEALENGEVSRFRTDKIEELRDYLAGRGYLDDRPTLQSDQIWPRVMAASAKSLQRGWITTDEIRSVIARVVGGGNGGESRVESDGEGERRAPAEAQEG